MVNWYSFEIQSTLKNKVVKTIKKMIVSYCGIPLNFQSIFLVFFWFNFRENINILI